MQARTDATPAPHRPALSVCVATKAGVVWSGTDGYADVRAELPLHADDRFCVGSITKTFVGVVVLQLVDEGKLDLAKTSADYLSAIPIVAEVANTDSATLRHLLSHQSGVATWEFEPSWIPAARGAAMVPGHVFDKAETLRYCTKDLLPPTGEPGEKYSYSNTNYTLLGLIIEAVTGNDCAAEIRSRILEPLNLRHTYLESFEDPATLTDPGPSGRERCSHYHYATPEFLSSAGRSDMFESSTHRYLVDSSAANMSPEWVAGGMMMSARDLAIVRQPGCCRQLTAVSSLLPLTPRRLLGAAVHERAP